MRTKHANTARGKLKFTSLVIERLPIPEQGRRAVWRDTTAPGLELTVTANGVKTFSVFRRIKGGHSERIALDRFPGMTVEQARDEAAKLSADIASPKHLAEVRPPLQGQWQSLKRSAEPKWLFDDGRFSSALSKLVDAPGAAHNRIWGIDQNRHPVGLRKDAPRRECGSAVLHRCPCRWVAWLQPKPADVAPSSFPRRRKASRR